MKTRVMITNMTGTKLTMKSFVTELDALQYLRAFCDENNMPYENNSESAGGRGHDYYIQLMDDLTELS